jgi:3-phytase
MTKQDFCVACEIAGWDTLTPFQAERVGRRFHREVVLHRALRHYGLSLFSLVLLLAATPPSPLDAQTVVIPRLTLDDPVIQDQDDLCIWVHPSDPALSILVTSDKAAGKLFVYDLDGTTLQVVDLPGGQPGNIDLRYNFDLQGSATDIIAVNDRNTDKLLIYRVNRMTRQLERIDNDAILTANNNYGLSLYLSPMSGKYYCFSSTEGGVIQQFELSDENGQIAGTVVRTWDLGGITEGSVCDDENAVVFFGEEDVAVWKIGAEPTDPTDGTPLAAVGDTTGIAADIEGLAIYYAADGEGYLIASSQGNDSYRVFQRKAPHAYVGSFMLNKVGGTDGIDVSNVNLGPAFPQGVFAAHNDRARPRTIEVCGYEDIGLQIDTDYWDPREGSGVGTLIALGTVQAEPGRVQLTWYGGNARGRTVAVNRRTEGSVWSWLANRVVDGNGRVVFEDVDVEPGVRYGYRVGIQESGAEVYLGEVWVDVPTGFHLALHGLRPNPSESDLVIAFSLRDQRPAELEIFDASGRRRWSQRVESMGPGNHVLNLGRMVSLPAGVYLVRITQGDASISRRGILLN